MAIIRKFKSDFTTIPNSIINNPELSLKAVGLWVYLSSKPETWNFSVKGTVSQKKDGRDSVGSGMKELEINGYLKRIPRQNNDGKWDGYDYEIHDEPFHGNTVDGKTVDVKPVEHSNTILSNTILSKKEETLFPNDQIESIPKKVIQYLNNKKKSTKPFEFTSGNLKLVESRIKDGFKFEDFTTVIDFKVNEWTNDDKMKKYIRPETLFGNKFNGYLVASEDYKPSNDGSNNFQYDPQQKANLI